MVITFLFSLLRNLQAMASPAPARPVRQHASRIPPPSYLFGATVTPSVMACATAMALTVREAKRRVTHNPNVEAYLSEFDGLVMTFPPGYPNIPNISAVALWHSANKKAQKFQKGMSARPKTADGLLKPLAAGEKSPLSIYRTDARQLQEPARNTKHRIATPELPESDSKRWQPDIGFVPIEDDPIEDDPDELFEFDQDAQSMVG